MIAARSGLTTLIVGLCIACGGTVRVDDGNADAAGGTSGSSSSGGTAGVGGMGAATGTGGGKTFSCEAPDAVEQCESFGMDHSCHQVRMCACRSCCQQWMSCEADAGCLAIRACMERTGCRGVECYLLEGTCREVIDANGGPTGVAATLSLSLNDCMRMARCETTCTVGTGGTGGGTTTSCDATGVAECKARALTQTCAEVGSCACDYCCQQLSECEADAKCVAILTCTRNKGCSGVDCYLVPNMCQEVIDANGGPGGVGTGLAVSLEECALGAGCPTTCAQR